MFEDMLDEWKPAATIAETSAYYHSIGEFCPWDCFRCDAGAYDPGEVPGKPWEPAPFIPTGYIEPPF